MAVPPLPPVAAPALAARCFTDFSLECLRFGARWPPPFPCAAFTGCHGVGRQLAAGALAAAAAPRVASGCPRRGANYRGPARGAVRRGMRGMLDQQCQAAYLPSPLRRLSACSKCGSGLGPALSFKSTEPRAVDPSLTRRPCCSRTRRCTFWAATLMDSRRRSCLTGASTLECRSRGCTM